MQTSDFDFEFPPELIAHVPANKRDHSRLMVLNRQHQTIENKHFYDIVDYLKPGDLLVLNDTKVMPANLIGRKEDGGAKAEVLLVKRLKSEHRTLSSELGALCSNIWECLVKPGKRLKVGSRVIFGEEEVIGTVLEKTETGEQIIGFSGDLEGYMHKSGQIPLPPYVKMTNDKLQMTNEGKDSELYIKDRYQTVYAKKEGAAAAPTAGLHFTSELLKKAKGKGVGVAYLTLHTGLATFKPIYADKIEDHTMHSESFEIPEETIAAVKKAKRVIAVGTTSVRALETMGGGTQNTEHGTLNTGRKGETNLFIYPGYKFKVVNAMITNFHWPRTSLILLVSAFAGKEFIKQAYQTAIQEQYRFFSFGDAMFIV